MQFGSLLVGLVVGFGCGLLTAAAIWYRSGARRRRRAVPSIQPVASVPPAAPPAPPIRISPLPEPEPVPPPRPSRAVSPTVDDLLERNRRLTEDSKRRLARGRQNRG